MFNILKSVIFLFILFSSFLYSFSIQYVNPNSGLQGDVLNVELVASGANFTDQYASNFNIEVYHSTLQEQLSVSSIQAVNSNALNFQLSISSNASVGSYDIACSYSNYSYGWNDSATGDDIFTVNCGSSYDCNGVCGGTAWNSGCGCVPASNSGDECDDCAGTPNGDAWESDCGCVAADNSGDDCDDCFGVPNGTAWNSECGCVPASNLGDECDDCAGTPNGDAWESDCGCVAADNSGDDCDDCFGVPNGTAWNSDCGCVPASNSGDECDDCAGTPNGDAIDLGCGCGEVGPSGCDNVCGSTADYDCEGVCGGAVLEDICGICGGGSTECSPLVISIVDIANDQGGIVEIEFYASEADNYELSNRSGYYMVEYCDPNIYVTEEVCQWVGIPGSSIAYGQERYTITTPSVIRSVDGQESWRFRVLASMDDHGIWVSDVVSGYSVDNLSPDFTGGDGEISAIFQGSPQTMEVSWISINDNDISHYNLYKKISDESNFGLLSSVEGLSYSDSDIEEGNTYEYKVAAVDINGNEGIASGIVGETTLLSLNNSSIPETFTLYKPYPNPFNPITTISFSVPEPSNVTIEVFNLNGIKVSTLVNKAMQPGFHEVSWNAESQISGIYFVKMISNEYINTQRTMLVK